MVLENWCTAIVVFDDKLTSPHLSSPQLSSYSSRAGHKLIVLRWVFDAWSMGTGSVLLQGEGPVMFEVLKFNAAE